MNNPYKPIPVTFTDAARAALEIVYLWLLADGHKNAHVDAEFNMRHWSFEDECGTICCIGGSMQMAAGNFKVTGGVKSVGNDHTDRAALALFTPNFIDHGIDYFYADITPDWAARCVRKALDEGIIDWVGTEYAR